MFVPRSVTKRATKPATSKCIVKLSTDNESKNGLQSTATSEQCNASHEETCNTICTTTPGPSTHEYANEATLETGGESDDEDNEPVVSYSKLQRWAEPGEPVCVVCGRYGAYIVDKTDKDVCSLECKARHLLKYGISVAPSNTDESCSEDIGDSSWVYHDHTEVARMTENEVVEFRKKHKMKVKGDRVTRPVWEFKHLSLPNRVEYNMTETGYSTPTAVQMATIPVVLSGRDTLVCASTGSGKTLSFLLPTIVRLIRTTTPSQRKNSPRSLVLTPTRELAMQIEEQAKQLMKGVASMRTALLVGGLPIAQQLHRLKSGVQIIVATPARLNDIIENHPTDIDLSDIETFILDEVDCLLHLGFETQVREIEELLPSRRQNLMFSATVPPFIDRIAKDIMNQPITICVGEPGVPCESVKHTVIWVEETSKRKKLIAFFNDKRHFKPPVVVFVNSKMGTLLLADAINKICPNLSAVGFHGDMAQERRSSIVQGLQEEKYSVVVATPILGRGVDLTPVKQVFIFDLPSSFPEYIHQVGRAGSLTSPGWAVTFVNNENKNVFADLVDVLQPLGVQLPSQLLHSPLLNFQREKRKRKLAAQCKQLPEAKRKNVHDRQQLMELIKDHQKSGRSHRKY